MPKKDEQNKILTLEKKDLVPSENPHSVITTPSTLKVQIEQEKETRKIVTDYIRSELKAGIDFGQIEITSYKTGKSFKSKESLFKPGSEKICSIFHLRPTFTKDEDTWEMSGKIPGLYCYLCELVNSKGEVVGEGRGAANRAEKTGQLADNIAIKIAQKRAQTDAVIRAVNLSDVFTQDVEDMKEDLKKEIESPLKYEPVQPTQQKSKMTLEMYQGSIKNAINVEELEKLNNDIIGDQGIPGVFKSQLMTSIRTRINSLLGEATKVEIPF
jgi:hypothetical protein